MMPRRPRSSVLAGALGFIAPGLGHLYLGRARRFAIPAIAILAIFLALGLAGVLSTFIGMAAYLVALAVLYLYAIADPPMLARRLETFVPKWYNHWYGYAGWVAILIGISVVLPEVRESLLGYSTFRVATTVMTPTIEPGEIILVDTHAFRSRSPTIGDVVVVQGPQGDRLFIRRVSAQANASSVSLVTDKPLGAAADAALATVPVSHIRGRVTYVLYSPTASHIGRRVE